jgi:hypothetical protein
MPIGYKIVEKVDNKYYSSCQSVEYANGIEYKINKWTKRKKPYNKHGALAVFIAIENALSFLNQPWDCELVIFKCEYKKSRTKILYYSEIGIIIPICTYIEVGTDFASSVKLLEEIKYEKGN